jgi:hypothetical protein
MQRVIRTELYFDPFDIEWRDPTRVIGNPGISMVFYRGDPSHLKEKAIQLTAMQPHLTMLRYSEMFFAFLPPFPHDMSETDIRAFLDSALQNDTFGAYMGDRPAYAELNTALINQIFETPVVIENSPPEIIPFHQLISKPSILAVGTFLGLQLSGLNEIHRDGTGWLGIRDSNSKMSAQIIPLKNRTDLWKSSRMLATETIRV